MKFWRAIIDTQRILLTTGRSPVTLDLARRLNAAGHEVFVCETSTWHVCNYSNAIKKSFVVPSPRMEPEEYIGKLVDIVSAEKIDFLVPTWEDILYVSTALDRFPDKCRVFSSPFETIHMLHNKWLFHCEAKRLGLGTPDSTLMEAPHLLRRLSGSSDYILKPCYSRATQKVYRVKKGESPPDVEINNHNPWVAQEWIHGDKYCTYSVCLNGQVTAHTTYPVTYAIDDSSCLHFTSVRHERIEEWVKTFIKETSFTGQLAFDFIEEPGGRLCAIECNPRATSGVHLFSGSDQFERAFFTQQETPIRPPEGAQCQIAFGMLLYGWRNAPKGYLNALFSTGDVIFSATDLLPLFAQCWIFAKYVKDAMRWRVSIPAAFTYDLDWNGELLSKNKSRSKLSRKAGRRRRTKAPEVVLKDS